MEPEDRGLAQAGRKEVMPVALPTSRIRSNIDFGIVVGVEDYCPLQRLDGAINDAKSFYDWLCDPGGGGLEEQRVKLILSDIAGAPQQADIDVQIKQILDEANELGGARRFYFYFSGHGAGLDENDVALLLARWSSGLERLALSTHRYSGRLSDVGVFEELAVFVDCCRSGEFPAIAAEPVIDGDWKARSSTRVFVAYATEARQPTYEFPESERWHGIFTRCLLSILHEASNGGVPADTLRTQLHLEVPQLAKHCGVVQQPDVHISFLPGSLFGQERLASAEPMPVLGTLPVVGRWLRREPRVLLELTFPERRGVVVIRDARRRQVARFRVVAKHKADHTTWRRRLPVGLYLVEDRDGKGRVYIWHNGRRPHAV